MLLEVSNSKFLLRAFSFEIAGVTQLVECNLAKVDVAGSNPVSRSLAGYRGLGIGFVETVVILSAERIP